MKLLIPIFTIGLSLAAVFGQNTLEIALKHGDKREADTKEQLQRLLKRYDVAKWTFTNSIVIDEQTLPHSHPVLSLHAQYLRDDELLLSTFVHEQLHWFLASQQRGASTQQAVKELQRVFPAAPTKPPEGSDGEFSTYQHMLVCFLEYQADQELLGELKARQVMEFWASHHYTWVYKMVLERGHDIETVITKYNLTLDAPPQRTNTR